MDENIQIVELKNNLTSQETEETFFNDLLLSEIELVDNTTELELIRKVCQAEKDSQKLLSKLYGYRAPISTIFILFVVIFAGAWSDRHDVRKPFILIPFLSEVLGLGSEFFIQLLDSW